MVKHWLDSGGFGGSVDDRYQYTPSTAPPTGQANRVDPRFASGNSPWRPISGEMRDIYTEPAFRQDLWRQFTGDMFGRDSYQGDWATQQYAQAFADFTRANEDNPDLAWSDYLTGNYAQQMENRFQGLNAAQRGERMAARGPRITW